VMRYAIHVKTAHDELVRQELADLRLKNVEVSEPGRTYEFT